MKSTSCLTAGAAMIACAAAVSTNASAHPIYYPHRAGVYVDQNRPIGHAGPSRHDDRAPAAAPTSGKWAYMTAKLPFVDGPDTSLLLTDGTIATHDYCTGNWYKLTPDIKGKYEDGTWSALATMPAGYFPFFFASQILPDGRMIMNGGEYNNVSGNCGNGAWTNLGALYDPVANSWTSVSPPGGWTRIGDAQSVILPNGSYMLADCCSTSQAIGSISGTTVTWTSTGAGKGDENDEEGWTILPNGNLLTVDVWNIGTNYDNYEIYNTSTGTWSTIGKTPNLLTNTANRELGPAVLRPDGTIIQFGANPTSGFNDFYTVSSGKWIAAPVMRISTTVYDAADAPAALLPDGNVLVQASPGVFKTPSHFWEFSTKTVNGKLVLSVARVNDPSTAAFVSSFEGRFLELPTGQVLWSNDGQTGHAQMATYTPAGAANPAWLPVISSVSPTLTIGSAGNAISGTNFNGFSPGATYGDDAQMPTNYPLVRLTNTATGDVCFGRSYNFSTMGVWTTGTTNAVFDIPGTCESGASTLQVIVNGLASVGVSVTLS